MHERKQSKVLAIVEAGGGRIGVHRAALWIFENVHHKMPEGKEGQRRRDEGFFSESIEGLCQRQQGLGTQQFTHLFTIWHFQTFIGSMKSATEIITIKMVTL